MIANKEGGVSPRSADHLIHRRSSRWNPSPTDRARGRAGADPGLADRPGRHADGHWVGELEGDTILESEYILLLAFLGREARPGLRKVRPLHPRSAAPGRRLGDLPGRAGRAQRLGQGVLRAEAGGLLARRSRAGAGPRGDPARRAAPRRATASPGSTWRCWARSATTSARACRRSWCCCRRGSDSASSAMSAWTRTIVVPLSIMSHFKPVRHDRARARASASCSSSRPAPRPATRDGLVSLVELLPGRRPGPQVGATAGCPRPGGSRASRRPTAGCSSTSRTPTAWVRSSRR